MLFKPSSGAVFCSILLAAVSTLLLAHPSVTLAAPCDSRSVTAGSYSAIEAEFHACVLHGLAKHDAIGLVEDECAIQYHTAIDTDQEDDETDSSQAAEVAVDWWAEY